MAKGSNTVDYRVKLAIDSKEYRQALRQANQEAKEFKKQQRDSFKTAGKDAGDAFSTIIGMAKKFAPAISAGAAAFQVMNKAMQENQTFTDEWARVTESAKATYESFVDSLVNADFTGFFQNLDDVVAAARDAADAIDNLDTTTIFASKGMADIQLAASKYRYTLRSKTSTEEEKAAARAGLQATRQSQMAVAEDLANANLEAFAAKLADYVTRKGQAVSVSDFITYDESGRASVRKGSLFDKYYGNLATYRQMDARYKQMSAEAEKLYTVNGVGMRGKDFWSDAQKAEFNEMKAFMELSDAKLKESFGYYQAGISEIAKVYNVMASDARYLGEQTAGTGGGRGKATAITPENSIAWLKEQIAEFKKEYEAAITDAARNAAKAQVEELELRLYKTETNWKKEGAVLSGLGAINALPMGVTVDPSKLKPLGDAKPLETAAKDTTKYIDILSDSIQSLGLISVKADSEFGKFLMVVRTVLSLAKSVDGGLGTGGKWYDKLFSIVGSVVGVGFAGGGIVGGTSYKGDRLPAMINSREMILNGFQQKQLFDMITAGGGQSGGGAAVVTGENIYIALRNYGRRSGKKITIG
jgi:hypothetical protein